MKMQDAENKLCWRFDFGLIVTGKGERKHLPKLFKSLMNSGICTFTVIRFAGQRSPITSPKRILKMVGSNKTLPDKDIEEIGYPAREYLNISLCNFFILIDDLEYDRREQVQQIFDRYRQAIDTTLKDEQKTRASVHFLVNMLEAYYFADANALNSVLNLNPPLKDDSGDVEDIRHPKNELKALYPGFREVDDGGKILDVMNVEHVLDRPDTCKWLRTLFAWCVDALKSNPNPDYEEIYRSLAEKYQLENGQRSDITRKQ